MPLRTLLVTASAGLTAFAFTMPGLSSATKPTRALLLEEFFHGNLSARGRFRSWVARVDRGFSVRAKGALDDGRLTLTEDFLFDDGVADRKNWVFTRVGPGRYTGKREDVVGVADIVERDGRIHMTYLIDLPNDGNPVRMRFRDVLYYGPDGKVINEAIVTKFGIPIARVHVIFEK